MFAIVPVASPRRRSRATIRRSSSAVHASGGKRALRERSRTAARALLNAGQRVRAIVRDAGKGAEWRVRGCEMRIANLEEPHPLAAAFAGSEGGFGARPCAAQGWHSTLRPYALSMRSSVAAAIAAKSWSICRSATFARIATAAIKQSMSLRTVLP